MKSLRVAKWMSVAVLAVPMVVNAGSMKPGKWQVTIQMDMPNMPVKMAPITTTHCVTAAEAEKPQPPSGRGKDDCKVSDYKMDGNTVTWSVKCDKQKMTGTGTMTYKEQSYEGVVKMKSSDMDITQKMSGKRIGECSK